MCSSFHCAPNSSMASPPAEDQKAKPSTCRSKMWFLSLPFFWLWHTGSQFPEQGSNQCPMQWKVVFNNWTTREVQFPFCYVTHPILCSPHIQTINSQTPALTTTVQQSQNMFLFSQPLYTQSSFGKCVYFAFPSQFHFLFMTKVLKDI